MEESLSVNNNYSDPGFQRLENVCKFLYYLYFSFKIILIIIFSF